MSPGTALPCAAKVLADTPERENAPKEDIIMKALIVLPIALTAAVLVSQTKSSHAKKSQLDGVWELVSGQPLPKEHAISK
jgi:hypothetical protein